MLEDTTTVAVMVNGTPRSVRKVKPVFPASVYFLRQDVQIQQLLTEEPSVPILANHTMFVITDHGSMLNVILEKFVQVESA